MSNWEETQRQTQDTLARLCLTVGLETPHVPLEEFEGVRQQNGQGLPCSTNPENKLMDNCAVTFMHKEAPCLIWSGPFSCSFSSIFIKKRDDTNLHSHVLGTHTYP